MSIMDPHTIVKLVEALVSDHFKVIRYSGRGMYGKQCVGIVYDSPGELIRLGALITLHPLDYWGVPRFELRDLQRVSIDSMGLSTVAYWPHLEWPHGLEVLELDKDEYQGEMIESEIEYNTGPDNDVEFQ